MFGKKPKKTELDDLNDQINVMWDCILEADAIIDTYYGNQDKAVELAKAKFQLAYYTDLYKDLVAKRTTLIGVMEEKAKKKGVSPEVKCALVTCLLSAGLAAASQVISAGGDIPVFGSVKEICTSGIRRLTTIHC